MIQPQNDHKVINLGKQVIDRVCKHNSRVAWALDLLIDISEPYACYCHSQTQLSKLPGLKIDAEQTDNMQKELIQMASKKYLATNICEHSYQNGTTVQSLKVFSGNETRWIAILCPQK